MNSSSPTFSAGTPLTLLAHDTPHARWHLRKTFAPVSTTGLSATLTGPACPSRESGWRVHATDRASRVASVSLWHTCCRQYPGGDARCSRRSLPGRWLPSPKQRRVGLRIILFEACSAFTRVAACVLAEPPIRRPVTSECFSPCRYLHDPLRRLPAGATVSRAGFAPAGSQCLSTAHVVFRFIWQGVFRIKWQARSGIFRIACVWLGARASSKTATARRKRKGSGGA